MEFVAKFIEIIFMCGLLLAIVAGFAYAIRHRQKFNRWVENYEANTEDKELFLKKAQRDKEDAEARIKKYEAE